MPQFTECNFIHSIQLIYFKTETLANAEIINPSQFNAKLDQPIGRFKTQIG